MAEESAPPVFNPVPALRIGDIVSLRNADLGGFLFTEGILVEDLGVADERDLESFEEALFHIQPQYQYSAFRECKEFEEMFVTDMEPDKKTLILHNMLKRGVQNEIKLNQGYTLQKHEQKLVFGDVIQLRHAKSGKFVTVISDELARDEKENIKISLSRDGNPYSWFQVLPRYKINHEGDTIFDADEVILKIVERANEYMHTADAPPETVGKATEVNSSLERTSWVVKVYESVKTRQLSPAIVCASQIVFIHEPETKSNLTIFSQVDEVGEADDDGDDVGVRAEGSTEVEGKPSEIVLQPMGMNVELNSNVLWVVESVSVAEGGPVVWRSQTIRLRNLNSGLYLNFTNTYSGDPGSIDQKMLGDMTTGLSDSPNCEVQVYDLNSSTNYLQSAKAIQVGGSNFWLERLEFNDKYSVYSCRGNRRKDAAVNLLIYPYLENEIGGGGLPSVASTATKFDQTVPFVVSRGLSVRSYLQRYYEMTVIPPENTFGDGTIWPEASRADANIFFSDYTALANFISANDVTVNREVVVANRQKLFREQGTLDVLMRWLDILVPISRMTDKTISVESSSPMSSPKKRKAAVVRDSDEKQRFLRVGSSVLKRTLELLFFGIYNNLKNQMYIADFMPILLAHVGAQPKAAECVTEMLSKNVELQETKIGIREITIFTEKLRSSRMNSMYINLLKSCCSCEGNGVDGNQCKVTEVLFENINDIVLQIHPNFSRLKREPVKESLYYLPSPDAHFPTMGGRLLYEGVPELAVTWTSESMMFNPIAVFGKMSERIDVLYLSAAEASEVARSFLGAPRKSAKSTATEFKAKVANYLISQLFLAAEMCMDRNYVAIKKWDEFLTFEICTAIIQSEVPDRLKAASVRLLTCMHIDRDPQTLATIPCLTRVWSDYNESSFVARMPCVEDSRLYVFGILQQFIAVHLDSIKGRQWNDLSYHTVYMLLKLILFQFYGTEDRLLAIIAPLVSVVDRRHVIMMSKGDDHSLTSEFEDSGRVPKKKSSRRSITMSQSFKGTPPQSSATVAVASGSDGEDELDKEIELAATGRSVSFVSEKSLASEKASDMWQKRTLDLLTSLPVMSMMMALVFIGIVIAVYEVLVGTSFLLFLANIVITSIFAIELLLRMYSYFTVHRTLLSFVMDFLNDIDILVVLVDVVIFSLPDTGGGTGFTRALRLARLIRLGRLFRAKAIVAKLTTDDDESVIAWDPPTRYAAAAVKEMETIVGCMEVLLQVQALIEDRNLSLLLRGFALWQQKKDTRSPTKILESVVDETGSLTVGVADFDEIALDLLMYQNPDVVQSVLNVVVAHHTSQSILLSNLEKVQLLTSEQREVQFQKIKAWLQELERNAETHELWGALESEEDHEQSRRTFEIMESLLELARSTRMVLMFDQKYQPEKDIQDAMRHLGFVGISQKVLQLMASVEEDELDDPNSASTNTLKLVQMCNELLYWFFFDNKDNQELGFLCLDTFLDSIEDGINSHRVIESIFVNNEALIRRCPRTLIEDFVDKICKHGRKHIYLSLLKATSHDGPKGIIENQFEIVKHLIAPARVKKTVLYCCPINQPEFSDKVEDMLPYLDTTDITIEELPETLAYHLEFLDVLSGCTVGKMNISTVEAKVQSVFFFQDVLQAMMHPHALLLSKIKLGVYFYEAMVDVEMMIPGLAQCSILWKLLFECVDVVSAVTNDLQAIEDLGVDKHVFSRQDIEYAMTLVSIVQGFFSRYYDASQLALVDSDPDSAPLNLTPEVIRELIVKLGYAARGIDTINSSYLTDDMKEQIHDAVQILEKSSGKFDNNSEDSINAFHDDDMMLSKSKDSKSEKQLEADAVDVSGGDGEDPIVESLAEFISILKEDEDCMTSISEQCFDFIAKIEDLPSEKDAESCSDVRLEPLITKLVAHVRDRMTSTEDERRLDPGAVDTTVWMITSFRNMIQRKWGMTIDERDDDGGEEQDIASEFIVDTLNKCGVTALCLDLMAEGILPELMFEAVKLCVAMLFREGGCLPVQETIYQCLTTNNSELFFKQLRASVQRLIAWHKWNENIVVEEDGDVELPGDIIFLRFMQLTCEGHYLNNQDILREQRTNATSVNLVDDLVQYLNVTSRIPCRTSTDAGTRCASTILEIIQGPCVGNQEYMVLNTELIETLNRVMRSKTVKDCVDNEEVELKKGAIDILQGLLEGQGKKRAVYERVLSVIHLDSILLASKPSVRLETDPPDNPSDDVLVLRSECLVLLQMLAAYRPSILEELGNLDGGGSHTASVEVVWRGELQRRFYHIPKMCEDLSKSSRAKLVEAVDRSNTENKLLDFLGWSRLLYREIKHEQVLKEWRVNFFFSQQNVSRITWFQFTVCCVINFLMWVYYYYRDGKAILPDGIDDAVKYLSFFLVGLSCVSLVSVVIVRGPIVFQGYEEDGHSVWVCYSSIATDPLTVYYFGYLVIAACGAFYDHFYLTLLLLDIVKKNSLTRDILNSVVYPRKQIALTCLLITFVCYIFAYIYFADSDYSDSMLIGSCHTLWECFKLSVGYSLRLGGGFSELETFDLGTRYIVDSFYFMAVILVLLNIFFGIIIDTFGELRTIKAEKMADTTEICFICGIDNQTFDRASPTPRGFQNHIDRDHNMWNYFFYILYIWEQDKDDDDGLEQFVRRCVDANDINWFPVNRAMTLDSADDEMDATRQRLLEQLTQNEQFLLNKFSQFQYDVTNIMENLAVDICAPEAGDAQEPDGPNGMYRFDTLEYQQMKDMTKQNDVTYFSINIVVVSLNTKSIPESDMAHVSCRIITDGGIFEVQCSTVEEGEVVKFVETSILVSDRSFPGDDRGVRLQVLVGGKSRVAKFEGSADVTYGDLVSADGLYYELPYKSADEKQQGSVTVLSSCSEIDINKIMSSSIDEDDESDPDY